MIYVQPKDLPATLFSALQAYGFERKDLPVEATETYTPDCAYGTGCRQVSVKVDLETGERTALEGSWGGSNPFVSILHDQAGATGAKVQIAPGVVYLSIGLGHVRSCKAYAHPTTFAPILPKPTQEFSHDEQCVLYAHKGLKAGARKDYYSDYGVKDPQSVIASLASRGLLKVDGRGSQITTEGKNTIAQTFPGLWSGPRMPRNY